MVQGKIGRMSDDGRARRVPLIIIVLSLPIGIAIIADYYGVGIEKF